MTDEPLPPSPDEIRERKLRAKRHNERVKLLATALNNSAVATTVGALVIPLATGSSHQPFWLYWIPVVVMLHLAAQASLHLLRSED